MKLLSNVSRRNDAIPMQHPSKALSLLSKNGQITKDAIVVVGTGVDCCTSSDRVMYHVLGMYCRSEIKLRMSI